MKLNAGSAVLRAPTQDDAASIVQNANNRKIWLNLRDLFPHPYTLDDAKHWIEATANQTSRWSFVIDVDGNVCGGISLHFGQDIHRMTAELGYWLGEEYWGRGIMSEAVRAITQYGLEQLGLIRIFAMVRTDNSISARVLEKNGYEREGTMRNAGIKDGTIFDMFLYARIASS